MELLTDRLRLIPFTEETVNEYLHGEEIGPHIQMFVKELKYDPSLLGWGVWLVLDKKTKTVLGDIGFKGKPDAENQVEVGYGIRSFAQNNGITDRIVYVYLSSVLRKVINAQSA
ncbi:MULTISPECIES: GNAT family N-acetyltransferase [unclassified Bacillus (in: firmicutes)]|uniref:GNAT family N-acetyltransferase n=1 Tax=unclassified Bacillus (in: firmicutes) TaxID=185979 RepID=UPI0008E667CA|nr:MULTISPECIES: GNAT family N-acetyltransferase [unclassified Bacillus (in: firmicutes)]SFA87288.1 ribosomal-protein-alanine N-acetyltransferase [Bacillus sp. UNCCL13]SFQ84156.1 ribosomal-protein-alanine N-acetyltransferase [Bacillus sp. cl95]